jgi:CRP-like cAMP-binding protein
MNKSLTDKLESFFGDFSSEEQVKLLAGKGIWKKVSFKKDDVVFEEGANSNELYLLTKGHVKIAKKIDGADALKVLAVLDEGAMFGEGALLSDKNRSASAIAKSDEVEALMLSKADFDQFVKDNPADAASLLLGLMKIVNQRLQWTNHELVVLYDVSRIVSESKNNMDELIEKIAGKLELITRAPRGLISLENMLTQMESVATSWGGFDLTVEELEAFEAELKKEDTSFLENEHELVVGIRDLSGNFLGLIVMEHDEEWTDEFLKVALAIAEQLGIAIADSKFVKFEKDRSTLAQEGARVNF